MLFIAHTENPKGQFHHLKDHLQSVGVLAKRFAHEANAGMADAALWAGLLHDLGKYRDEFQEYLRGERESSTDTHHAVYGAALAHQRGWLGPAFSIAGHHAGLHDCNQLESFVTDSKYKIGEHLQTVIDRFSTEISAISETIQDPQFAAEKYRVELYTRMLFSAVVDADFLDTEAHFLGTPRGVVAFESASLLASLVAEKESKSHEGEINKLRNDIFQQCLDAALRPQGFFSLTVPTGGGKTIASMAFALAHAKEHGLRRIIVVIPYLSIIEQNANEYRRIFDPEQTGVVVEHHSSVEVSEDHHESCFRSPLELAAENWDAPIIVTTSVQFIESLFANRPSRCRKLHNIARSVVILDEVQTLPSHLLNPLLNILRDLRENYGVSFVFSTATQPAFQKHQNLSEGFQKDEVSEITENTKEVFFKLRRVAFELPKERTLDWISLADSMCEQRQALCVVNVRKHAFELWEKLHRRVRHEEQDSIFHLSSAMCAQHRFDVLGTTENSVADSIRNRLRNGEPCRVVSTQLVEAGVDVDFPVVYRALGPLDSIVQAAGRCNREGRLSDPAGNPALGKVTIFRPEDHSLPTGTYRTATDITTTLLAHTDGDFLATDHLLFQKYFDQLYQLIPTDYQRKRENSIQEDRERLRFREVARKAWVIRDQGIPVIVPYGKAKDLIETLRSRNVEKGRPRFERQDLRRLQRYMVNVNKNNFQILLALKQLTPLLPNLELYVLSDGCYHSELGVLINQRPSEDFIL